jgi:hypothetical protein
VVTTLQNQHQPDREIQVIYAFTRAEDPREFKGGFLANSLAIEVPVIQLIFYLLAFPEIDKLVFLNDSQNLERVQEIDRVRLEESIANAVNQHPQTNLPPDVC